MADTLYIELKTRPIYFARKANYTV